MVLQNLDLYWMKFFCHLSYSYNKDDYEMLIRILHSFLNKCINVIRDHSYNDSSNCYLLFCVCGGVYVCVCMIYIMEVLVLLFSNVIINNGENGL